MTQEPEPAAAPEPMTTDDVGFAILRAVHAELKAQKRPFVDQSEHEQELLLRRLEEVIRAEVARGFHVMAAAGFPNAMATLDRVAFSHKGVQGKLSLAPTSDHRHALSDHAGREVIVVLATAEKYLERMAEVRGDKQQPELPLIEPPDTSGFDSDRAPPSATVEASGEVQGDGAGEPAAPIDDPYPGELSREQVLALLEIAEVAGVDLVDVSAWDQDWRRAVADWAGAVALQREHPDIFVPTIPAVLMADSDDDEEAGE